MQIALRFVGANEEAIVPAIRVGNAGGSRGAAGVVLAIRDTAVSTLESETRLPSLGAVPTDRAGGADAMSLGLASAIAAPKEGA